MDDAVFRALRRKYAAAQAVGDLARMDLLRRMMAGPAETAEAPLKDPTIDVGTSHFHDAPTRTWVDGVEAQEVDIRVNPEEDE